MISSIKIYIFGLIGIVLTFLGGLVYYKSKENELKQVQIDNNEAEKEVLKEEVKTKEKEVKYNEIVKEGEKKDEIKINFNDGSHSISI